MKIKRVSGKIMLLRIFGAFTCDDGSLVNEGKAIFLIQRKKYDGL